MRIAEIAPVWCTVPPREYGGIELVVAGLTEGLVARGHDVTLFASGGSQTSGRLSSPLDGPSGIGGPIADEAYHVLSAYLRAHEFDVIHDHTWLGPALGAMVEGPAVIHTLHGPWDDQARRHYGLLDSDIHLVAISHTQRAANPSVEYAGVVHNGIDLDAYPMGRTKEDFLLFVGRSCREKGPETAVDVARQAGLPLVMVVKRQERPEQDYWREHVEPRLTGRETILEGIGHDTKVDLMSRAKATLFPIDWPEPFGLVMIESMACGTPVIAMRIGAATEVVADQRTGFLCSSPEEMVEAVRRIDQISPSACRAHVGLRFSAEAMVTGYERIFERLGTPRPAPAIPAR